MGSTYQAALTFGTVAGQTYYIETGGFENCFDPSEAASGLLRLQVN